MKDLPSWISAIAALIAIPISIWAIIVSKNAQSAIKNVTTTKGPTGIVQSGGTGSFNIGEMRVGHVAQQLAEKEYGISNSHTSYSQLSNKELKQITLSTVLKIRELISQMDNFWNENSALTPEFINATSQEKEKLWAKSTSASQASAVTFRSEYNSKFRINTILLRDELRSRLPKTSYKINSLYEDASVSRDFGHVADNLEILSKQLTD